MRKNKSQITSALPLDFLLVQTPVVVDCLTSWTPAGITCFSHDGKCFQNKLDSETLLFGD